MRRKWCDGGTDLRFVEVLGLEHVSTGPVWVPQAAKWLAARFEGKPDPGNCGKNNIFGLVNLLGREPVGALSFLPEERAIEQIVARPPRRPIGDAELSDRIRDRESIPFPVWDGTVRLSVAGYQDKLQVLLEGDQISLVEAPLASTHILKPGASNPGTPFMVANEHFCMTLAMRMGLPAAFCSSRIAVSSSAVA